MASWIRDPKIEHQKKSSLPARAEHSSLPAAPQAKQLSPAALLQACPSPQAGSTGADKPSVPSAHPEDPVVQSPARPRRLLPPTNTPSSFRVPPPRHTGSKRLLWPQEGRREAGRNYFARVQLAPRPWHESALHGEAAPQHPALPQLLTVLEQPSVFQQGRDSAGSCSRVTHVWKKKKAGKKKFVSTSSRLQG